MVGEEICERKCAIRRRDGPALAPVESDDPVCQLFTASKKPSIKVEDGGVGGDPVEDVEDGGDGDDPVCQLFTARKKPSINHQ